MAHPKQAIYELKSGHEVTVTPLTGLYIKVLEVQAAKLHPAPDPEPFRKPLTSKLGGSGKTDAKDNPNYEAALKANDALIRHSLMGLVLDAAVAHPDKDVLIERHAPHIPQFREVTAGNIRAVFVTDWVCVLFMILADDGKEIGALYDLALGNTPLSEGEISDGLSYFRSVALRQSDV